MEIPTRRPKARAMRFDLWWVDCPPRNMKYSAAAKLPKMATKAMVTRVVMDWIIW